jgi:hypothetical protein
MAAYIYTIAVQAEIISLILYHNVKAIKHLQETLTMQDLASNFSKCSWGWQTTPSTR